MKDARTSAILRGVLAAGLLFIAACESSTNPPPGSQPTGGTGGGFDAGQQPSPGTGGQSQDSGSPAPPVDTAPMPFDTAPTPPADARDVQPTPTQDVAPLPPVDGGGTPAPGGKLPVAPSAGCTTADHLPEGAGTLPSGRRYVVRLPTGYDKTKPFPLVFGNHPNSGSITMFDNEGTRGQMRPWAILVLTASQTSDWRQAFPADLAYFDALVPLLKSRLCVDTNRIYSFGFSGGSSFSMLLACTRDFLKAVGGGGGIPGYNGYTAADCKPMPAWIDEGMREGLVELWTAKNGCTTSMAGNRANCRTYTCTGPPVVYCTNGAHTWPGYGSADVAAFFKQF